MNVKSYIPLVMAAGLGLAAMIVARKVISKGGGGGDAGTVTIVVANRDVGAGQALTADDLQARKVSAAPPKAFRDPKDLVERVTTAALSKGDAFVESLLAESGAGTGLPALVEKDHRAVTVEVNEMTGVGGMLVPGCRVDVMAIVRDDKRPIAMAKTVLQNIRVAAVGRNLAPVAPATEGGPPPPAAGNVTLMVTPRQAHVLQIVSQSGKPWLVLRNGRDVATPETEGVTLSALIGGDEKASVAPAITLAGREPTTPSAPQAVSTPRVPASTDPFTAVADATPARAPAAPPASAVRIVRVIRGGVEADVSIAVGAKAASTLPASPAAPERRSLWDYLAGESNKPE